MRLTRLEFANLVRFALAQLATQNGHHEFEHICREIARVRMGRDLLPSTGPVGAGGDGGIDFETFTWGLLDDSSVVFCCSIQQQSLTSKIRDDVRRVKESRPSCRVVFFFTNQPVPVGERNKLKVQIASELATDLTILDREALTELLTNPELLWIVRDRLHLPTTESGFGDGFVFESIELDTTQCLWQPMGRIFEPESFSRGSHQLRIDMWPEEQRDAEHRTLDPIFDLTLINRSVSPLLLTAIGFEPVRSWTKLKGLPVAAKVMLSDAYALKAERFEFGRSQLSALPDPVYLQADAAYRFKLRLSDYRKAAVGNQSVIRLIAAAGTEEFASSTIFLGMV